MKTFRDAKGRVHRQRPDGLWVVECPLVRPTLYLPAIRETGGGDSGSYYAALTDGYYATERHKDYGVPYEDYLEIWDGTTPPSNFISNEVVFVVGQMCEWPALYAYVREYNYIWRAALPFDTSDLPVGCIVSAATLKLYCTIKYGLYDTLHAVSFGGSFPVSGTDAWTAFGDTSLGSLPAADLVQGQYNSITLNPAAVSVGDTTKIGLRSEDDINAVQPVYLEHWHFSSTNASGTDQDPLLELVYSLGMPGHSGQAGTVFIL
ncbi:MAG: hypothetical protein PHU85_13595 [Phycisphaerae bacterium]|nr:hypothetical protein [Phycisphaerae bacterium]